MNSGVINLEGHLTIGRVQEIGLKGACNIGCQWGVARG